MLLEAEDIWYRYENGPWVLRGVDISLGCGEIVGLTGKSGCGKSTLGRILAGYQQPYSGSIRLGGLPFPGNGYNPVQLVLQHPEKAVNPRWRMGKTLNEGWVPDENLLRNLGIEEGWLNRWPNEISGGELQRFCVARALGPQTKFLIADEMTTMLDAINQAQIWQIVIGMVRSRNLGVLVISHERSLINRLCDRNISLTDIP